MTNGEKMKEIFSDIKIITQYDNPFGDRLMVFTLNNKCMQVNIDWWNAEYKEPTTKNDLGVDCISRSAAIRVASGYCHPSNIAKELAKLPPVTPQEPTDKNFTKADIDAIVKAIWELRVKEVLDKIRTEVENINVWGMRYEPDTYLDQKPQIVQKVKEHVIEIIDKYKAESEDKE